MNSQQTTPSEFKIKIGATDYLGNGIEYPNTWRLTNGNPQENWQSILVYLEERYGNQSNKSIKTKAYPEDLDNLSLLSKLFPGTTSATIWLNKLKTNKVVKSRAPKENIDTAGRIEDDELSLGTSSSMHPAVMATSYGNIYQESMSLGEIFRLSKESLSSFTPEAVDNLKLKYKDEVDTERKIILQKIICQFGRKIVLFL